MKTPSMTFGSSVHAGIDPHHIRPRPGRELVTIPRFAADAIPIAVEVRSVARISAVNWRSIVGACFVAVAERARTSPFLVVIFIGVVLVDVPIAVFVPAITSTRPIRVPTATALEQNSDENDGSKHAGHGEPTISAFVGAR